MLHRARLAIQAVGIAVSLAAWVLLASCTPPTAAQRATVVKSAIDAGRAACLVAQAERVELTEAQRAWCLP